MVISYDDEGKNARLSLRQTEILADLQEDAQKRMAEQPGRECVHPENVVRGSC
jgi:glutamate--cysteine ligase catalytic subunit